MAFEKPQTGRVISSLVLIETLAMIAICMVVGKLVSQWLLDSYQFTLPTFVCVLFTGVILSNSLSWVCFYRVFDRAVSVLGNVSLSLFFGDGINEFKTVGTYFVSHTNAHHFDNTSDCDGFLCYFCYLSSYG